MSQWRRTAIARFPQMHRAIADADGPGWMWFELLRALEKAYRAAADGEEPLDEAFVADVYGYAQWCLTHRSIEIRTAVVLWFYEHLPDDHLLRSDMARWLSQEDFDMLEFAWRYVLKDPRAVEAFQEEFAARKAEFAGHASKRQRQIIRRSDKGASLQA